jgi:hypothetical protein
LPEGRNQKARRTFVHFLSIFGLSCPVESVDHATPKSLPPADSGRKSAAFWPLYAEERTPGILKQLQRWLRLGKEAGIPAPLGDPVAMVEWYGQMRRAGHLTHVCPTVLTQAAARHSSATAPSKSHGDDRKSHGDRSRCHAVPNSSKAVPETQQAGPPLPVAALPADEVLTPKRRLQALEDEEVRLHRRYIDVLSRGGTDSELDVHRERWKEMSELVVQTRQRLEKSRDILDPSEVNAALPAVFSALMQAVVRELAVDFPADKVKQAVRRAWERAPANVTQLLSA